MIFVGTAFVLFVLTLLYTVCQLLPEDSRNSMQYSLYIEMAFA